MADTIARTCPPSNNRPSSTSCFRSGRTTNQIARFPSGPSRSGGRGTAIDTSRPPYRGTPHDRSPGVAADRVKHDVEVGHGVLEAPRTVVDHLVGAQLPQEVVVTWAPRQRASWTANTPPPATP